MPQRFMNDKMQVLNPQVEVEVEEQNPGNFMKGILLFKRETMMIPKK